jgi:hypothetical protein
MAWNLTATGPPGVAPGTVPVAVVSTTAGLQGFARTAVAAGAATVSCVGTTGANALQGSLVTVVFAPGVAAAGTVSGPGAAAAGGAARAVVAVVAVVPLLPPLPPLALPPPPLPLVPVPLPGGLPGAASQAEVPVIPEPEPAALLLAGLAGMAALARWRRR